MTEAAEEMPLETTLPPFEESLEGSSIHQQAKEMYLVVLVRQLTRCLGVVALIVLGLVLAAWLQLMTWTTFSRQPPVWINDLRMSLKQWWLGVLCRLFGMKIHRKGGPWTGTVLMACNHISWMDIPILGANVPFHFLSKAEISKWPIIGWLARVTGTLFIRRGSGDSRSITRQLSNYLSQGNCILFFPEGTTSDGSKTLPFHSRLFESAITSDVVIQPITIAYSECGHPHPRAPFIGDDSLVPHIWQMLGEKSIHVHLHYHPPVKAGQMKSADLARTTRITVNKGLQDFFPLADIADPQFPASKTTAGTGKLQRKNFLEEPLSDEQTNKIKTIH